MDKIIICKECFKSNYIKEHIAHNVEITVDKCIICNRHNGIDLMKNEKILEMITNLIAYNYSLLEYSRNFGMAISTRFGNIFGEDNPIFNGKLNDDIGITLLKNIKTTKSSVVDHWTLPFKFVKSSVLIRLEKELSKKNYYEVIDDYMEIIKKHLSKVILNELEDDELYRARIGFNTKIVDAEGDLENRKISFPYIKDELEAPPPMKASSGRFNKLGCSFLYLASDKETAIAEIKPDPGQICSVGTFKIIEKKQFIDLRKRAIDSIPVEDGLETKNLIDSFARLFSEAVPKEETHKYFVTQFLSEIFRTLGYSGIMYDSPQNDGEGYNVICYYPDMFRLIENSEEMFKIEKVKYKISDALFDERKKYKYFEFKNEEDRKKYGEEDY
ncbi:MAG: RES family NAD+ phosphorylase [Aeromonadales bacterium]|jgi:hypothetical protein|nr:RES family NAD+ phosphorylase [Aeromonadales bacterium]